MDWTLYDTACVPWESFSSQELLKVPGSLLRWAEVTLGRSDRVD